MNYLMMMIMILRFRIRPENYLEHRTHLLKLMACHLEIPGGKKE